MVLYVFFCLVLPRCTNDAFSQPQFGPRADFVAGDRVRVKGLKAQPTLLTGNTEEGVMHGYVMMRFLVQNFCYKVLVWV